MRLFDYIFNRQEKNTASQAKDRLQLVVAHQRFAQNQPDYFPKMQREILEVIRKYVDIDETELSMQLDQNEDCSILELNLPLTAKKVQTNSLKSKNNKPKAAARKKVKES